MYGQMHGVIRGALNAVDAWIAAVGPTYLIYIRSFSSTRFASSSLFLLRTPYQFLNFQDSSSVSLFKKRKKNNKKTKITIMK